jgi:hypothetical protein
MCLTTTFKIFITQIISTLPTYENVPNLYDSHRFISIEEFHKVIKQGSQLTAFPMHEKFLKLLGKISKTTWKY